MTPIKRGAILSGVLAMALPLVIAAPASAGDVFRSGDVLVYSSATDVPHAVDVDDTRNLLQPGNNTYRFTVTSTEATTAGAGCQLASANVVTCSDAGSVAGIVISGRGGSDTVTTDADDDGCGTLLCRLERRVGVSMTISGQNGGDTLAGGTAGDVINGGDGNDTLAGRGGADTINGGAQTDTVSYDDGRGDGATVTLASGGAQDAGGPLDGGPGARDDLTGIENVTGSQHADVLIGDDAANTLNGLGGDDSLDGRGAGDNLVGGDGLDTSDFSSRGARVTVTLNSGCNDGVAGESDCAGTERVIGTAANDALTGSAVAERFVGGAGADAIDGGGEVDTVEYTERAQSVSVTLTDGVGDDGGGEDGAPGARDTVTNVENVFGGDGADLLVGDMGPNLLIGRHGDDILRGRGAGDQLRGDLGTDIADYADKAAGEPVTLSLDGVANDGEAGENDAFESIEIASGGSGADTLTATVAGTELRGGIGNDELFAPNGGAVLRGGFGNDTLNGGDGADQLFGDDGDDDVEARDGVADGLDCGEGFDTALTDNLDTRASCEAGGTDADRDGFSNAQDCDDFNPSIRPNVPEIPGNDVDENCDNVKSQEVDRDGDGFTVSQDCNDRNRRIRPNAREIPGNRVDENCDRRVARFALPPSLKVPMGWQRFAGFTRLTKLDVTGLRKGAKVILSCTKVKGKGKGPGCPFLTKRAQVRKGRASVTSLVRGARFRTGAQLQVKVTTPGFLALVRTARFENAKDPRVSDRCQAPRAKKLQRCR